MFPDHVYANITRDELWRFGGKAPELGEQRVEQGHALTIQRRGTVEIRASDDFQRSFSDQFAKPSQIHERLMTSRLQDHDRLRDTLVRRLSGTGARARIVSVSRYVENEERSDDQHATVATVKHRGRSITVTIEDAEPYIERLLSISDEASNRVDLRSTPMVWRGGSGAVLLHEAIGHPAERSLFRHWPDWLRVTDQPATAVDDTGQLTSLRTLTREQVPSAIRRQDFRAVPVRRLTNLAVHSTYQTTLPNPRLEVWLAGDGHYDPLLDSVILGVSHALSIDADKSQPVPPFQFRVRRDAIQLEGAAGPAEHYPGVICVDEGQHLPVGSSAPDLITAPFE